MAQVNAVPLDNFILQLRLNIQHNTASGLQYRQHQRIFIPSNQLLRVQRRLKTMDNSSSSIFRALRHT